ncbi:hypothetical protein Val02_50110 [Virgisporangium aliadipatigenens]|uniref:Uncharacterized protein n=1 Tax=Virgisporangium aliadipatigenens TaxID=741659 RepID=A0A8J3YQI5_9ACTN|nr:hypothetical protein Val02_50110 [Virgisporangium aliadipatigenens]
MLRELAELTDPAGVLSVYATADPGTGSAVPAWQVRIVNELVALERRLAREGDADRAALLAERLSDVEGELKALIDTTRTGRGRALFVPLNGGPVRRLATQALLGEFVELGPAAHLRPLVAALSAFPPAGVVTVDGRGVRLIDVRLDHATDVELVVYTPRAVEHLDASHTSTTSHGVAAHDVAAQHAADHLGRFLHGAADTVAGRATELGWERLVVCGEPVKVRELTARLPLEVAAHTVSVPRQLAGLSAAEVYAAVASHLRAGRRGVVRSLVENAVSAAHAGGAGALGLADVLTALAQGQVRHLLLAADREWRGRSGPDGALYPEFVAVPGVPEAALRPDAHLGERMIVAALRQGAAVTLLDAADAGPLAEADGAAAVLRW